MLSYKFTKYTHFKFIVFSLKIDHKYVWLIFFHRAVYIFFIFPPNKMLSGMRMFLSLRSQQQVAIHYSQGWCKLKASGYLKKKKHEPFGFYPRFLFQYEITRHHINTGKKMVLAVFNASRRYLNAFNERSCNICSLTISVLTFIYTNNQQGIAY